MDDLLSRPDDRARADEWSHRVIGAAIEVHRALGPGLLEPAYQKCMCRELEVREIPFVSQRTVHIEYKGMVVENAYKIDVLVAGLVVVELKAVEEIHPVHEAQLMTYLRLTNIWLGLLINFNVPILKSGIRRRVLG